VPKLSDLDPATLERFPGLKEAVDEQRSLTDLEVLHAVTKPLHPQQRDQRDRQGQRILPSEHAFFYLREPSYLDQIPEEPAFLKRIYTDDVETDAQSRAFLISKQQELIERVQATCRRLGRSIRTYSASWDRDRRTPALAFPLHCS
jgi:hypothetical protein